MVIMSKILNYFYNLYLINNKNLLDCFIINDYYLTIVPLIITLILLFIMSHYFKYQYKNGTEIIGIIFKYYLILSPSCFLVIGGLLNNYQTLQSILKNPIIILFSLVIVIVAIITDFYRIKKEVEDRIKMVAYEKAIQELNSELVEFKVKCDIKEVFNENDIQYYQNYRVIKGYNQGKIKIDRFFNGKLHCFLRGLSPHVLRKEYQFKLKTSENLNKEIGMIDYSIASVELVDITDTQAVFIISSFEMGEASEILTSLNNNDRKKMKNLFITIQDDIIINKISSDELISNILSGINELKRQMV